jgi:hypothetical protein
VISLDGEAIDFADLFSRDDGLHELDDKERGTRRSIGFKTISDFRSQISEYFQLRSIQKAGPDRLPLSRLPLHHPSVFSRIFK